MKKQIIFGVLIKQQEHTTTISRMYEFEQHADPDANLDAIYTMLECGTIDVATRKFGRHYYDVYCDDEGLLKPNPLPSIATFKSGQCVEQLVGNVFICKHDGEGGMKSLTQAECDEVVSTLLTYRDDEGNERAAVGATL